MRSCFPKRLCLVVGCLLVPWSVFSGCGSSNSTMPALVGTVKVEIQPEGAVAAGARWKTGGPEHASGEVVQATTLIPCTVSFTAVPGYQTPANISVSVTGNQLTTVTGVYTPIVPTTGTVTVNITPAGAVTAGARWTLDGGATQYSPGTPLASVAAGDHTVAFTAVDGYTTPASQTITVTAGATTTVDAAYTAIPATTGTIRVICEPAGVRDAGAQWAIDGGAFHDSGESVAVEPGSHEISYKYVNGWYRPATLTIDVVAGEVYERTITYSVAVGRGADGRR